jgi:1,4-alpha-glucan branching enzyme
MPPVAHGTLHGAPDPATVQALQNAEHGDPFSVLGPHTDREGTALRVLLPGARQVAVTDAEDRWLADLAQVPGSDLWCVKLPRLPGTYRLRVDWGQGPVVMEDAYRFDSQLRGAELWWLAEGTHLRPYEALGAHPLVVEGVAGVRFAVWAPSARRVSVVGSFNQWDGRRHPMRLHPGAGIWDIFVPQAAEGDHYRFEVLGRDGVLRQKADPYANRAELRPAPPASCSACLPACPWTPSGPGPTRWTPPSASTRCTWAPGDGDRTAAG